MRGAILYGATVNYVARFVKIYYIDVLSNILNSIVWCKNLLSTTSTSIFLLFKCTVVNFKMTVPLHIHGSIPCHPRLYIEEKVAFENYLS